MATFDVESIYKFLEENKKSATKTSSGPRKEWDGLNHFYMYYPNNRGTISYIPVYSSDEVLGHPLNFFHKIPDVFFYNGVTSLNNKKFGRYVVLPEAYYEGINDTQKSLYHEVVGNLNVLNKKFRELGDKYRDSFKELQNKVVTLIWGSLVSHYKEGKKINTDRYGKMVLFEYIDSYDSKVLDAMNTASRVKLDVSRSWGNRIFIPTIEEKRYSLVQISNESSSVSATFDTGSEDDPKVPKEFQTITPEMEAKVNGGNIMSTFLGITYDKERKSIFNEQAFYELRDLLKTRVEEINNGIFKTTIKPPMDATVQYENKNDLTKIPETKVDSTLPF